MDAASDWTQAPAFYRLKAGKFRVTALCDGTLALPPALFAAMTEADEIALAQAACLPRGPIATAINCFVIETGDDAILVDTGTGPSRGPATGRLVTEMQAAGIDAARIRTVLLTHLHGDHCGGLLDANGSAAFPHAQLVVAAPEQAFWADAGRTAALPDMLQPAAELARRVLAAHAGRITTFTPGDEVFPGIRSVPLFGHTPGHTGFVLGDGPEALFIWADIVHVAAWQFPHPEWGLLFDVDPAQAAATRARTFAQVADDRRRVAGMHLPFPGLGHVAREGDGFRYVPSAWAPLT